MACYKAVLNAIQGRRQLMVSFSYKTLKDVILRTLNQCLEAYGLVSGKDYTTNLTDMIVTVRGTQILLRSGDNPDAIRGIEVSDVYIDEAREFKDNEIFLVCIGRMSESDDGQWHITSSPKGKDWVYKLIEDDDGGSNIELIVQKTSENPFLPPNYERELRRNYTMGFANQELEAEIIELGGSVIDPRWFNIINPLIPSNGIRFWDTAVTVKTSGDYSVGALCTIIGGRLVIVNIIRDKFLYPNLKKKIVDTAMIDTNRIRIGIESVGQSRGFVDDLKMDPRLRAFTVLSSTPVGDKLNRCLPWVSRAESGLVDICRGAWNDDFKEECSAFTASGLHKNDDIIDAVSGAWKFLAKPVTTAQHRKLY